MRFRIAPSPTGFLHAGNLLNFQLNAILSKSQSAELGLRIDDIDQARFRPEYLSDIFNKLEDLGIEISFGSTSELVHLDRFSQLNRVAEYRRFLAEISDKSQKIFRCICSRAELKNRKCVANCRSRNLSKFDNVIRFDSRHGDEVLWRREDIPSYLLTDLLDDTTNRITHIVRGIDLYESTAIQKNLRKELGIPLPVYIFHPLVVTADGKLSKTQGGNKIEVSNELRDWIDRKAGDLLPSLTAQLVSPIQSAEVLHPITID